MSLSCSQIAVLPSSRLYAVPTALLAQTLLQMPSNLRASSLPSKVYCRTIQLHCSYASSDSSREASVSPPTRIFIKGLSQATTEGVVAKAFSQFGKVNRVKIVRERRSGESLGFAYVWFDSEESAEVATEEMNGKFFGGRFIVVTIARPESPTSQYRAAPYKF